jgi:hypothetical protein
MGFYFRKSANLGPFRINFSKSGIGGSLGVPGVRITRTARGTTYVTVGKGGFYYRETISTPRFGTNQGDSSGSATEGFSSQQASNQPNIADMVGSSSEKLVQQLNHRANLHNPAWLLYAVAAVLCISTMAIYPSRHATLPNANQPYSAERKVNTKDDYATLVAYYGNPNSIRSSDIVLPKALLPTWVVHYVTSHVLITLVPNGCVDLYEAYSAFPAERRRYPTIAADELNGVGCPSPPSSWTIVAYADATDNYSLSAQDAEGMLARNPAKRMSLLQN